jgi:type I restriction enzyme, S subunit
MIEKKKLVGWVECLFSDVIEIISGKNQKLVENSNGQYPIYGSGGIMSKADQYLCEAGTTIIGRKGTINSPIYVSERFWNVDTAFGLSPFGIHKKLFYYYCLSYNFKKLDKSTTIPSLAKTDLLQIEIPLPPVEEQLRIVAKIEELFSDLDKGIETLKIAKEQLKVYRQAVLKYAFEGRLTNPDLEDGELPISWTRKELNDVCVMKAGFFVKASEIADFRDNGSFPCYGGNGLRGYVKGYTHQGTFPLIGRQGALCGNVHLVEGSFHATEHAVVVTPKSAIDVKWLYHKLSYMKLNKYSTGTAQPGLSVNKLLPLEIDVPTELKEQIDIVQEIESRLSVCDKIEESIEQGLQQAEALRQSILKKAFEGKLAPQDPNDEPAHVLLERIKAERAAAQSVKKQKKVKV